MKNALYLLSQLTEVDIDWMVYLGEIIDLKKGDILITEGENLDSLFFLLSGSMDINVDGVGKVAEIGLAEVVGEISMIDNNPTTATVVAVKNCRILSLTHKAIEGRVSTYGDFGTRFYKALATSLSVKMRNTIKGLESKSHKSTQENKEKDTKNNRRDARARYNLDLAMDRFDHLVNKVDEMIEKKERVYE